MRHEGRSGALENIRNFDLSPAEAIVVQRQLAPLVDELPLSLEPRLVAGFDLSIHENEARAAVVVLDLHTLETVDQATVRAEIRFPYIPGLLSFREAPGILAAYETLRVTPDVVMLDGQGRAHPRRFGVACHIGLILGLPSIGAAKSPLVGRDALPGPNRGDTAPLIHRGEVVGSALRTRSEVRPIYVSVGHLITLKQAEELTLKLSPRWRVPEPTRRADSLAGER